MAAVTFIHGVQGNPDTEQTIEVPAGGRVPVVGDVVYLPELDGEGDGAFQVWFVALNFNPDSEPVAYARVRRG